MTRLKHPAGATIVPDVCRDWVSGMKIPSRLGSKRLALENSEADLVIRFLRVPAILHSINSNEEQAIRDQELPEGTDLNTAVSGHDFQTVSVKRHEGKNVRISRTMPKKISREKIRKVVALQLNE